MEGWEKGEKREKWSTLVKNDELRGRLLHSATAAGENIPPHGGGVGVHGLDTGRNESRFLRVAVFGCVRPAGAGVHGCALPGRGVDLPGRGWVYSPAQIHTILVGYISRGYALAYTTIATCNKLAYSTCMVCAQVHQKPFTRFSKTPHPFPFPAIPFTLPLYRFPVCLFLSALSPPAFLLCTPPLHNPLQTPL